MVYPHKDVAAADAAVEGAAARMPRTVAAGALRALLARNLETPRWDEVADRCLTCGNCTMVCPTCFCTSVEEIVDSGTYKNLEHGNIVLHVMAAAPGAASATATISAPA